MKAIKFEGSNYVWGAPKGMEDDVNAMHAWKGKEAETNLPVSISCWEPTEEDIARIIAGGKIWLRVYSEGHPPVSISSKDPWG